MTTLAENFRAYLLTKTAVTNVVSDRVFHNRVPQGETKPYIVFFRRQSIPERALGETASTCPMDSFDVEFIGTNLDVVDELAEATRAAIDGQRGTFGGRTVQGVWVEDHDENYIPHADESDKVDHVPSFIVEIRT